MSENEVLLQNKMISGMRHYQSLLFNNCDDIDTKT